MFTQIEDKSLNRKIYFSWEFISYKWNKNKPEIRMKKDKGIFLMKKKNPKISDKLDVQKWSQSCFVEWFIISENIQTKIKR